MSILLRRHSQRHRAVTGGTTITRLQASARRDNPVGSGNTFGASVTAGSLLIAVINTTQTPPQSTATSVADNLNGSWSEATQVNYNTGGYLSEVSIWYKSNAIAGSTTVSATYSTSSYAGVAIAEYGGMRAIAALDGVSTLANDTGTTHTIPSITTTTTDLLIAVFGDYGANRTFTAGSGWTRTAGTDPIGLGEIFCMDRGVGTSGIVPGSYTAPCTCSGSNSVGAAFAAFKV